MMHRCASRHILSDMVSWFVFHTRTRFLWTTVRTASPQHAPPQRPKKKKRRKSGNSESQVWNRRFRQPLTHIKSSSTSVSWGNRSFKMTAVNLEGPRWHRYFRGRHTQQRICTPAIVDWPTNSDDMHACISSRTVECSTRLWGPQTFNKIQFVSTIRVSNPRLNPCPMDPHLLLLSWNHRLCT